MLSRSGLYALQATLHLAQQPSGTSVSAAQMALQLSLPGDYLAKVLHRLSREGILASTRGSRGGYRLTVGPEDLSVEKIVAPFDEIKPPITCLMGGPCDEERPCPAHQRRLEWNQVRRKLLAGTNLTDLLEPSARDGEASGRPPTTPYLKTGS
jgi:Rrf2 family protein